MLVEVEVAIIGQGIVGQAIAFRFLQGGIKGLAVFDRADADSGTSAAQAVVSMKGATQARDPLFKAKLAGFRQFPHWIQNVALESCSHQLVTHFGAIEPFCSESEYQELMERSSHGESFGLRRTEIIGKPELKKFGLRNDDRRVLGALHFPDDCHSNPQALTAALRACIAKGCTVLSGLEGCDFQEDSWLLSTGQTRVKTKELIVAAGPWTNEVLKLCIGSCLNLKHSLGTSRWYQRPATLKPGLLVLNRKFAWSVSEDLVSIGTGDENPSGLLESFADEKVSGDFTEKSGIRVRTPSRFPLVFPIEGTRGKKVMVATGFYKSGFQLASIAAESVWSYMQPKHQVDSFMQESMTQNAKYNPAPASKPKLDLE